MALAFGLFGLCGAFGSAWLIGRGPKCQFVHETGVFTFCKKVGIAADIIKQWLEPTLICLCKVPKNVPMNAIFMAGMTDANSHAAVLFSQMSIYGAYAVMAARTTAGFDAHLARSQVQLIVEYDHICNIALIESCGFTK